MPASTSSASRLVRMNSFNAVGLKSIDARLSPRISTQSSSYPPRDGSLTPAHYEPTHPGWRDALQKKCCTATPASDGELNRNTCGASAASAPSSSASSRCNAASTEASVSSTPPPGAVQYGACSGFALDQQQPATIVDQDCSGCPPSYRQRQRPRHSSSLRWPVDRSTPELRTRLDRTNCSETTSTVGEPAAGRSPRSDAHGG